MRCPNCGRENPEDARFCSGCGARIIVDAVCVHCGRENPSDARFCVECGREISRPAAPTAAAAAPAAQPDSFAGGRYVVKRFLGEGGKKKVYLAHDTRLDRDVAFALIKTEGLDEAARERITREAQAMGRLGNHPNIVTVYDIGEEGNQPYLVLPVLEGGDVEGVIEKAPEHKLPLDEVVRIGVDTCEGLEFLHAKGLVHRDVKPGNTWLTNDGRAMIGDFGLAVAVDRSRLTQAGMMVGTVSYMAPEQAMGSEITPRSDLYALGALLYEMVCGRPPFVGDESVAIIGQHLNTPPVAPSWHRPDCPPALEALVLRLLEKDPEKRPQSAAEVRDALRAIGTSVGAVREPPLRGASAETARPGADPLYRTVFVGREQELKQLQQAFDAAMSGQGGLVMVVGEPGIGKTAICEQLATYVSLRGGRTLVGHCYEEGSLSLPYLAFVEAMRSYVLARDPDGLRSDLGSGAADVARIVSEVRDRVAVDLRDAGDPEDDRWRLLQSVTTFLRNAASVQPLVIVLEDLHWADRGTLDLLQHVARNLQGSRLVVVGTYRDVEVDRTHPLSGAVAELRRSGTFLRVPLRGLTVDEVHRMYESLRGNEVPWGQAEAVHRQTEGNPLFVQEVLRYLVEEGFVVREGGRYVAQQPGEGVPEGLRDVIGRRLSHLDDKTNTVLSVAAVIGRDFRLDVLQKVAGLTEDELYTALEQASEHAIVEQRPAPGGVGFRFTHAMFRTLLYEEIFAPRRIRLHQQVGRAFEEVYARRPEEHAAELAEHFSQSTETADLERAVQYAELAAKRALQVYAYGEAIRHYEQAIRAQEVLDPDDKAERCDLLTAYAEAMTYSGDSRTALEKIAPEALRLAEDLGDRARAIAACQQAFGALSATGAVPIYGTPEAGAWVEAGERYAEPDSAARVSVDVASAYRLAVMQQFAHSRDRLWHARELSRKLGDPALIWQADAAAGTMLQRPIDANDLLAVNLEMLNRSPEGAPLGILGQVYFMLSGTFLVMGRVAEA
ncbi:MAG TPA: protein kinase, partial [Dehalococcoidia bacterium]